MWKRVLVLSAAVLVSGCAPGSVQWGEVSGAAIDTLPGPGVRTVATGYPYRDNTPGPVDANMCPGSLVYAGDPWGDELVYPLFAAWLRVRPDSTVAVMAARYGGSGAWSSPSVIDSLDTGAFGCDRPAPSIAATNLYVHIAYSLKAPEGFGVFYAHSMDNGVTFHPPLIIVYGDRLSRTAVAAQVDRVLVAYEDPSGRVRRIGLAPSRTSGHTFEARELASPDEMVALRPRLGLANSKVSLTFSGEDSTHRMLRLGTLK
jgi:hypothetical protein